MGVGMDELVAEYESDFRAFVSAGDFPCLAAKGTVRRGGHEVGVFAALGSGRSARSLAPALRRFVNRCPADGAGLHAFVAVFPKQVPADEVEFERRLWRQLQRLHEADDLVDEWDPTVSADPQSAEFSFSFASRALFVVGLHPASSRVSRRFRWPALVFNPRAQFERMRSEGTFERLRTAVRERDVELQGTLNPNLADFGEQSEARQYSGRATEAEWRCPFHRKEG
jgi:FPC/CPF motif-containing protein YcgG